MLAMLFRQFRSLPLRPSLKSPHRWTLACFIMAAATGTMYSATSTASSQTSEATDAKATMPASFATAWSPTPLRPNAQFAARVNSAAPLNETGMSAEFGSLARDVSNGDGQGDAADGLAEAENLLAEGDRPLEMNGLCPPDMASIDDGFCVDRYEASLLEVLPDGSERAWPYYESPDSMPQGHVFRAVSEKGVYPQGYINEKQASEACLRSGKRLCKPAEWRTACRGPTPKKFGYANERIVGTCNDNGRSAMGSFFSTEVALGTAWTWDKMNDPRLNQFPGGLAETGSHDDCTNGFGVYDMVGNLHEWVLDPEGTFQGGYYLDVTQNGDGCSYRTDAHEAWYHDYSTGFRCCADPAP